MKKHRLWRLEQRVAVSPFSMHVAVQQMEEVPEKSRYLGSTANMELTWCRRAISTLLFRNLQSRLLIENLLAFPTHIDGAVVRDLVFLRRERSVSACGFGKQVPVFYCFLLYWNLLQTRICFQWMVLKIRLTIEKIVYCNSVPGVLDGQQEKVAGLTSPLTLEALVLV